MAYTYFQPVDFDLDQLPPLNINIEPDLSVESEYIDRAFMNRSSQSVLFSMNRISKSFTIMKKKCKVCQYCGAINPKQLDLCLKSDCGKPLV